MIDIRFSFEIHHGEVLLKGSNAKYSKGKMDHYDNVDPDLMSYFELQSICIDLGSPSTNNIYFLLVPNDNFEHRLKLLETDDNIIYMLQLHSEWRVFFIVIYMEIGMLLLNMRECSIAIQKMSLGPIATHFG